MHLKIEKRKKEEIERVYHAKSSTVHSVYTIQAL